MRISLIMNPFGFQEDEPSRRGAEHIRHDREQRQLQGHLDHPVPEQVGPAREEGRQPGDGHTLVLPPVRRRPAQPPGRAAVHPEHVRERPPRAEDHPLPPLHHRHRHAQHRGGVQLGQGHDTQPQPRVPDAAVTATRAQPGDHALTNGRSRDPRRPLYRTVCTRVCDLHGLRVWHYRARGKCNDNLLPFICQYVYDQKQKRENNVDFALEYTRF